MAANEVLTSALSAVSNATNQTSASKEVVHCNWRLLIVMYITVQSDISSMINNST